VVNSDIVVKQWVEAVGGGEGSGPITARFARRSSVRCSSLRSSILPVDAPKDDVEAADGGDEVGDHLALGHLGERREVVEAGGS